MRKFNKTVTQHQPTSTTPVFWLFDQNNSGGRWKKDLPGYLFIEAVSAGQANAIAEDLGVDFRDHNEFSGSRWEPCDFLTTPMVVPMIYDMEIEDFIKHSPYIGHLYVAAVVRLNGETIHYHVDK